MWVMVAMRIQLSDHKLWGAPLAHFLCYCALKAITTVTQAAQRLLAATY